MQKHPFRILTYKIRKGNAFLLNTLQGIYRCFLESSPNYLKAKSAARVNSPPISLTGVNRMPRVIL